MKAKYSEMLSEVNKSMENYAKASPKMMGAFMKLHHQGSSKGALLPKHKELIALGIAIRTQCEGCILSHISEALKAGASHNEIVETIDVAVYMGGGPCVIYGAKAFAVLQEFENANEE